MLVLTQAVLPSRCGHQGLWPQPRRPRLTRIQTPSEEGEEEEEVLSGLQSLQTQDTLLLGRFCGDSAT